MVAVIGRGLLGFQEVNVFVCQGDGFEVGCDADASAAGGAENRSIVRRLVMVEVKLDRRWTWFEEER